MTRPPARPLFGGRGASGLAHVVSSVVLCLGVLAGCPNQDAVERDQVLARIDALRDATLVPLDHRRQLLEALRTTRTGLVLGSEARDACVAAYTDLIDAAEREEAARRSMESGERTDPLAVVKALDDAEKLLDRSRENMPGCDQAATRLRAYKP